jgi:hypothetical protein
LSKSRLRKMWFEVIAPPNTSNLHPRRASCRQNLVYDQTEEKGF